MTPSNLRIMRLSLVARAVVLALAVVVWAAAPALAAPQVLSTDPEEGAQLHKAPDRVTIEFSEPLQDPSDIEVEDGCGERVDHHDAIIGGTLSTELSVELGTTPHHGIYTVTYVATGVSGTASDSYTFDVHAGKACDGGGGGGGHGGHDGGGNGGGGGHGGHGGGDDDGGDGDGHGGHDGDRGDDDHDGHGTMAGQDDDHMGDDHSMTDRRGKHGKHDDKHGKHRPDSEGSDDPPPQAIGELGPPTDIPTGTTVTIALGLALLMGALGGWVLRVSSPS